MGRAIGIDLGTTNTAVAVLKDGRPFVLEDEKGYKVLPSTVSLKDDGKFVVGQAARAMLLTRPEFTVYAVKRLMGRRWDSPEVEAIRSRLPFTIQPAPDGTCLVGMGDQFFTPVEVSALVLQVARSIAERALGEKVDEAVITVPAYFNHAQRAATFEAARLAGLRCERLLNEPTAAALAYGFRKDIERTLVIYDLGGGTFDVSVLRLSAGVYEILSTRGDTFLGGEDLDHRLVDHLANSFEATHKIDLREDKMALQRLKDAAERAKCELSFTDRTTVLIPRVTPQHNLEQVVSRLTLETLVEDLVQRTLEIVRTAVSEAGLKLSDVEDVILVGGQTRMPRVREAVGALFKKEPSRTVHPEEAVAIGAAVHASSLGAGDGKAPVLLDVTPFDLGIEVVGGLFQPIIARNSQVPTSQTRSFATVQDNQETVRITVRQGYSRQSAEDEFLGEFIMTGLTPAPRMQTKVDVTFRIDTNGMLHVMAVDPSTGERKRITVRNYAEVVGAKGGVGFELDGDVHKGAIPSSASAPAPAPGEPGAAAAGPASADKGKGGRIASFFGRMARRKQAEPDAKPAAAVVPEAEPEDLDMGSLEALPEEAVAEATASAAAAAVREDLGVGTLRAKGPGETDSVSVSAPGKRRIVLPEVRPAGVEEGGRATTRTEPMTESREEEPEADLAVNTVAIFGLAGESPSWERPDQSAPSTNAAVAAAPVTRGPNVEQDPQAAQGKWDFGLDINEDPGTDEDFERLFHALERGDAPRMPPPPLEDSDVNPTLMPLDTPAPRMREEPSASSGRSKVIPAPAPPTPAPVSGRRRSAPEPRPAPSPVTLHDLVGEDTRARVLGQDDAYKLFSVSTDSSQGSADRARAAAKAVQQLGEGFESGGDLDDLFALADELFSVDEAHAPPRRPPVSPKVSAPPVPPPRTPEPPRPAPRTPEPRTPEPRTPEPTAEGGARKPARLKLAYPRLDALIAEYRENLRRGGCFVRTEQPLSVGREVRIEVRAPGLPSALELSGVVTAALSGAAARGQPAGMTIEYRLEPAQRSALERLIAQSTV